MAVVVVGNEKGGCGKTTVSVNLAAAAAAARRTVLLVDADPGQQSASKWANVRRERHPDAGAVRCVSLNGAHVMDELRDFSAHYDVVVVDTGAEDSPQLRGAAVVADALIVPVQPDELDLWTLPTMEAVFASAKRHNPGLRPVIVLNRVPHQMAQRVPGEVEDWITDNVPGFQGAKLIPLIGRTAYGRASGDGLGVMDAPQRDNKASTEMARLYTEIFDAKHKHKVQERPAGGKPQRR